MKELNLPLNYKDENYIIGVSGGPDSMALLYALSKYYRNLIVCHVNYHTREESNYEYELVKLKSKKLGLRFFSIDAYFPNTGNFEAWARDVRYKFFKEIYYKYDAKGLFIAHHQDDLLETYIIQKRRGNLVKQWGFSDKTSVYDMIVYRPLIGCSKSYLLEYCNSNNIEYSIDSTNLEDVHLRNKIRHSIVEKMDDHNRKVMLLEIKNKNEELKMIYKDIENLLDNKDYKISEIMSYNETTRHYFFYELICKYYPSMVNRISWTKVNEIEKVLLSSKPNLIFKLAFNKYVIKEYDLFYISNGIKEKSFKFTIPYPSKVDNEICSCDLDQDLTFLKITKDSYPLTIRNAQKNDVVIFGNVKKKVNRIFVDEKIPLEKRMSYPIVVDKSGKVVYFPLYGSDIQKTIAKKLKFMIK